MSTPISDAGWRGCGIVAALLASGCAEVPPERAPGEAIACRLPGMAGFAARCTVARSLEYGALILTLHHPDGGFRRLRVTADGGRLVAADGAEQARETALGPDRIEVALGDARYRLPIAAKRAKAAR